MILLLLVSDLKIFIGTAKDGHFVKKKEFAWVKGKRPDLFSEIILLIKPQDIEGIIVYQGPGPFTGIRVAIAIANALSFALDVPIAGIKNISDPDVLLKEGLFVLRKKSKKLITPFYNKPPNVTKPKEQ